MTNCDGIGVENKKHKKTLWDKRLIAKRILIGSSLALAIGFTSGIISSTIHQNKIDRLIKEQDEIYEQYMASDEFKAYSNTQIINLATDYAAGNINYNTFKTELDKIYSTENADKLLEGSNHELKDDIEQIKQEIADTNQKYNSSAINIGSIGLVSASIIAGLPSAIAVTHYDLKTVGQSKIAHQEYETGPVLIDKKRNKKENNPSCNENCLGIRYYDSTTMTIRNTNGTVEEDEETLTK